MAALPFTNTKRELYFPKLARFFDNTAQPLAWLIMRLALGGYLIVLALPQLKEPFALASAYERIGLFPGNFWSPAIAALLIACGLMIAFGFMTRLAGLISALLAGAALWYVIAYPTVGTLLTSSGLNATRLSPEMFTFTGMDMLRDGGRNLIATLQQRTLGTALFVTVTSLLFACLGGGYLSIDRMALKKRI